MSEYIEFAVRVPKSEADMFITWFGKSNVKILGFLLGEKIVRCMDCKHLCDDDSVWACDSFCANIGFNDGTPPDGFCAWGEPKTIGE